MLNALETKIAASTVTKEGGDERYDLQYLESKRSEYLFSEFTYRFNLFLAQISRSPPGLTKEGGDERNERLWQV